MRKQKCGIMSLSLDNKVVIVTGASSGVGAGIAEALYQQGAKVIITARNSEELSKKARSIDPTGTKVIPKCMDVRNPEAARSLIEQIRNEHGALNCLVNNAGITGPHQVMIPECRLEDWQQVMETNVNGAFYMMKYALPLIEESKGGSIVNLSAVNGCVGIAGLAPYTTSKHAIIGLTQSAALEYAQRGVRINAVAPGYVATSTLTALPDDVQRWMAAQQPMNRMATVEEVANTVMFLLSPLSSHTTGAVYAVDGGFLAQ